ncbi:MAG: hypothetical protein EX272_07705 [Chromatiales bacterium]|nr:MAG: hypothetical protein EX272_07705 [Chromatiales bacterium]
MKKLTLTFCAVMLVVLGFYAHGRINASATEIAVEQLETGTPAIQGATFTVAAYNIAHGRGAEKGTSNWSGDDEDKANRAKAIGRFLADSEVDIVVLNEVDFDASWSGRQDQALLIAEAGNFPFIARQLNFSLTLPGFSLKFGNALLSRFPITHAERVPLPAFKQHESMLFGNHDAIRATIAVDETSHLDVWGLHLEVRDQATRISAAQHIAEQVDSDRPTVLAGDLNSELSTDAPTQTALDTFLGIVESERPLLECETTATFPTMAPKRRLDWIVHSPRLERVECGIGDAQLSDHLPVFSRFRAR